MSDRRHIACHPMPSVIRSNIIAPDVLIFPRIALLSYYLVILQKRFKII